MSAQKLLIGTLSGLVAGVAIGLLVAPASGSDTRQKIADTADDIKRRIRRFRGYTAQELDELVDIFENEAEGLKDDVRERALHLLRSAKKGANHVKKETLS